MIGRVWSLAVVAGALLATAGTVHTMRNLRLLRVPPVTPTPDGPTVSVLLPLRNEVERAGECLAALRDVDCEEIVVLDDASDDGTAALVQAVLGDDPRLHLLREHSEPPAGWLGKPWACQRLADRATGEVLLFTDADVVLEPSAARRSAALLGAAQLDVACPYPRQVTAGVLGRLVQPLLQWSWLTMLPLDVAESSGRPSTAAGNGQLLAITASRYRKVGGHASVRGQVLEDVALVRSVKASGGRGGMADGTDLATCTMYHDDAALVEGYTKSLWAAFGGPVGAAGVVAILALAYVVPPAGALLGPGRSTRLWGAAGFAAAVAGRVLVARRTGQRVLPDAFAHPASIVAFAGLLATSFRRLRSGRLSWRGRPVVAEPAGTAPDAP